jgi:hypothetical protein
MPSIRITGVSAGPAPIWVQQAWIGLELPLRGPSDIAFCFDTGRPATARPGLFTLIKALITGKARFHKAYRVDRETALSKLACVDAAADWYRTHTFASARIMFDATICETIA